MGYEFSSNFFFFHLSLSDQMRPSGQEWCIFQGSFWEKQRCMDLESNNGVTEPSSSKEGGRGIFKRRTYLHLWLIDADIWQKPTQYWQTCHSIKNKYYSLKAQCCFLPSLFYSLIPNFLQTFSLLVFMDYIF